VAEVSHRGRVLVRCAITHAPRRRAVSDIHPDHVPDDEVTLLPGRLLAFGLSFDEIVGTTFTAGPSLQTHPLWIS